ncbi:unnamed protein product [Periconia digitata]|uniref:Uncharacterized protein n=1 Tax=Periconia digitata TaxID=1303443 RepID=A0A9W4U136_9PLEO|nr:unnamed protein product [Periconia digitata]
MDPAALLDPRGARRRAQKQQNSLPVPTTAQQLPSQPRQQYAFDPRALLNPKRPAGAHADRGREDATEHGSGQFNLVERIHNVAERTASPAKRPRVDDPNEQNKKIQIRNGGSGGALDLTQKQGSSNVSASGPAAAIDLTMSDDEDNEVQVVQDNSNQVICIGCPKNLYVQTHVVPYPDPKKYSGNTGHRGRIKVSLRQAAAVGLATDNVIMVVDPTNREFGRIDRISAKWLAPLINSARSTGLKWMVWTTPRNRNQDDGLPGSPSSALIGLTMQLYCPRKVAQDIGRNFVHYKVALVPPSFDKDSYDYYNPITHEHVPADTGHVGFQTHAYHAHQASAAGSGNYVMRSVEEIRNDVQDVFDKMINSENIEVRKASPMIATKLYKHQEQALGFMWNKEQDFQDDDGEREGSLWKMKYKRTGEKYYFHVITGEEINHKPHVCRGGILADEMGLGKTLSILSLVADTDSLAAAKAFSKKAPPPRSGIANIVNSRATLLVCPLSTMYNWKDQLEKHFPVGKSLKWTNYHGKNRMQLSPHQLADHDVIITTYNMLQSDYQEKKAPLAYVHWFRIVLDEAHAIRNTSTKQSIAACNLAAERRWAVTGTPVQNRLEDLGALFRFLRLRPFDTGPGFNQQIITPFKNADVEIVSKLQLLVGSVTLRRVKKNVLEVEIPARKDSVVRLKFSPDEKRLHDWFESDSARKVNAVTSGEKLGGNSYARILTAITNLRLICAHGRDLLNEEALKLTDGMSYDNPIGIDEEGEIDMHPELNRSKAYDMLELLESTGGATCQYCAESIVDGSDDDEEEGGHQVMGWMTPCYQVVCIKHGKKLVDDLYKRQPNPDVAYCPFCDAPIRPVPYKLVRGDYENYLEERDRNRKNPKMARKMGGYTGPSTKTKALLEDLTMHKAWSTANPDEPPIKSVVFSSWTTHLDLIQLALDNHGFKYVRLDGRMSREARNRSLTNFDYDDSVHIILVSIGAGGLGLNLTKANKAFVMEPQFNPAAEAQAVDRVHRLGQTREVEIKRFIMDGSFEEKMLDLQRKKMALADLTMTREKGTKEQAAKQRLADLRSLFK